MITDYISKQDINELLLIINEAVLIANKCSLENHFKDEDFFKGRRNIKIGFVNDYIFDKGLNKWQLSKIKSGVSISEVKLVINNVAIFFKNSTNTNCKLTDYETKQNNDAYFFCFIDFKNSVDIHSFTEAQK